MDNGDSKQEILQTSDNNNDFNINSKKKTKKPYKFAYTEYINSANRLNGTSSSFSYILGIPNPNNFSKCLVTYACIPKTFYNIDSPYNSFTLSENGDTVDITLTPGMYNRDTLRTTLKTELDDESPNGYTYLVSGSLRDVPDTGKYTFTVSGNGVIQPQFIFSDEGLYEQMGFNSNSTNVFIGNELISPNVMYLQGERTLFIRSNIMSSEIQNDNVLQEIYSNVSQAYSSIVFQQTLEYANIKPFVGKNGNQFNFSLVDEFDRSISLNGNDFQFSLKIW